MADEFAGPRKLRYFVALLYIAVSGAVVSTMLAQFYGITFLEPIMWWFIENPMALFELAGLFSMIVLMLTVGPKLIQLADDSGF